MRSLSGTDDVTLCEFLLTVEANSEVAEYITMYLGASPAVSWDMLSLSAECLGQAACGLGWQHFGSSVGKWQENAQGSWSLKVCFFA